MKSQKRRVQWSIHEYLLDHVAPLLQAKLSYATLAELVEGLLREAAIKNGIEVGVKLVTPDELEGAVKNAIKHIQTRHGPKT